MGSSDTMGSLVDTASEEGVFNSDSCDGEGIAVLSCLKFGAGVDGYPDTGSRAV